MFRKFTKKRLLIVASVTALALAGIAYAFFSSTGSGTGSAGVGSAATGLTLHGSITGSLSPGGSKTVSLTADNTNTADVKLHNVTGTVSVDQTHVDAGCAATDFTFDNGSGGAITEDQNIPASTNGVALTNDGTVSMPTSSSNQDACQGASLTLNLSSN
jgi:hypothetical protein